MLRTSKRDYLIKQIFSSIAPLFKMRTYLRGKDLLPLEFAPRGSKFFPLLAVPYGLENHYYHIR